MWNPGNGGHRWNPRNTDFHMWNPANTSHKWNPNNTCLMWNPNNTCLMWNPDNICLMWNPDNTCLMWNPNNTCPMWNLRNTDCHMWNPVGICDKYSLGNIFHMHYHMCRNLGKTIITCVTLVLYYVHTLLNLRSKENKQKIYWTLGCGILKCCVVVFFYRGPQGSMFSKWDTRVYHGLCPATRKHFFIFSYWKAQGHTKFWQTKAHKCIWYIYMVPYPQCM